MHFQFIVRDETGGKCFLFPLWSKSVLSLVYEISSLKGER